MLQYSVYARHSTSEENMQVHVKRVEGWVPDDGEVRILVVTDKQFECMRIFWGKIRKMPAPSPRNSSFSDPVARQLTANAGLTAEMSLSNPDLRAIRN